MTEKEIILTHLLHCSRAELYLQPPVLSQQQQILFDEIILRRAMGEPLQYILGECEFMGFTFKVDSRVLIPRPETELLVENVIHQLNQTYNQKELSGIDLGTGSGNIAIALLRLRPLLRMTSIDISADALALARENAQLHQVLLRIKFLEADMFAWLKADADQSNHDLFDFVVSNPPYIKQENLELLPSEVKKEPVIALDGGRDGLKFYRHILEYVRYFLKPGGWIFFEIGDDQGKSLENLLTARSSFVNIQTVKDFNQRDRIVKAQLNPTINKLN